ncbi:MAG: PspA-associated protein PspAA [Chloroflexota bacterium]
MIVRIAGEGQYRLADTFLSKLNQLDNQVTATVGGADAGAFTLALGQMLALVRDNGQRLADDELLPSDVLLPAEGTALDEARHLFQGEGLIPG